MIRNAIQVFWSKPYNKTEKNGFGFKSLRHFYMSAFYSLKCLKNHGYNVTLVTDDYGKEILSDYFNLGYDKVDVSLNNLNTSTQLWGMSKIYAYSLQTEPFIYVDIDAYLINDISTEHHNADIICQNIEFDYPCYYFGFLDYDHLINKKDNVYKYIENCFRCGYKTNTYNTAIFGGNDLDTIKKYCNRIFDILNKNHLNDIYFNDIDGKNTMTILSIYLEQQYLYYYLKLEFPEINVLPLLNFNIDYDLTFFKEWNNTYVHLIFTLKKFSEIMLDKLEEECIKNGFLELEEESLGFGYENLILMSGLHL